MDARIPFESRILELGQGRFLSLPPSRASSGAPPHQLWCGVPPSPKFSFSRACCIAFQFDRLSLSCFR